MLIDTNSGMFIPTDLDKYVHSESRQLVRPGALFPLEVSTCVLERGSKLVTPKLIGGEVPGARRIREEDLVHVLADQSIHDPSLLFATTNSFQSGTTVDLQLA